MIRKATYGVGTLILLFGLMTFGAQFIVPLKTTAEWYVKVLAIVAAGGGTLALPKVMDKISGFVAAKENNKEVVKMADGIKTIDIPIELSPDIQRDYECLYHMIKRFASIGNTEGVTLCNQ